MGTVGDAGNPDPVALLVEGVKSHEEEGQLEEKLEENEGLEPSGLLRHQRVVVGVHVELEQRFGEFGRNRRREDGLRVHQDGGWDVRQEKHAGDGPEGAVDGHEIVICLPVARSGRETGRGM